MKLIVVGHARAGKTKLIQVIQHITTNHQSSSSSVQSLSQYQQQQSIDTDTESTLGIDVLSNLSMSPLLSSSQQRQQQQRESNSINDDIKFKVYDFAGQLEYLSTHQVCVIYTSYIIPKP